MNLKSELRALLMGVALVLAAFLAANVLPQPNRSPVGDPAGDVERLREHFRTVEAELMKRDVSHLTAPQRAARTHHIRALRAYGEAGLFPHNHNQVSRAPFFRDEHGTLCAMGYLMAESGATELVERIARTRNNAYIRELAHDPDLVAWLEQNGFTVEEATRIQPAYNPFPPEETSESDTSDGVISAAHSSVGL
jgi:hypothetical protein